MVMLTDMKIKAFFVKAPISRQADQRGIPRHPYRGGHIEAVISRQADQNSHVEARMSPNQNTRVKASKVVELAKDDGTTNYIRIIE